LTQFYRNLFKGLADSLRLFINKSRNVWGWN